MKVFYLYRTNKKQTFYILESQKDKITRLKLFKGTNHIDQNKIIIRFGQISFDIKIKLNSKEAQVFHCHFIGRKTALSRLKL